METRDRLDRRSATPPPDRRSATLARLSALFALAAASLSVALVVGGSEILAILPAVIALASAAFAAYAARIQIAVALQEHETAEIDREAAEINREAAEINREA